MEGRLREKLNTSPSRNLNRAIALESREAGCARYSIRRIDFSVRPEAVFVRER